MKKILVALSFLVFQISLLGMSINNKKTDMEVTVAKVKEGYQFTVKAPTKGWVGIGFEASMIMKDAEMIIMTNKDGKGFVEHYYGTGATKVSPISTLDKNYKNDNPQSNGPDIIIRQFRKCVFEKEKTYISSV